MHIMHGLDWDDLGRKKRELGHKCGFTSMHAMYATNMSDWADCIREPEFKHYEDLRWDGQWPFVPSHADVVHFYNKSVISLG
jgi:hypothetical protein